MSQEKYIGYVTLEIANILDVATHFSCLLGVFACSLQYPD